MDNGSGGEQGREKLLIPPAKLKFWYDKGFTVPLAVRIHGPKDPWLVAKPILESVSHGFFLDSVRPQGQTARYSYLGWNPFRIFKTKKLDGLLFRLRSLFKPYGARQWRELPFFTGGAVGYFSYELARAFEKLPDRAHDDLNLDPLAILFTRDLLVFDHLENVYVLITNLVPARGKSFNQVFMQGNTILERNCSLLAPRSQNGLSPKFTIRHFRADSSKRLFKRIVNRAKEYIESGDIYQANLSQRFSFEFEGSCELIYESLRNVNPSPFSSLLKMGSLVVAGSSPERLIRRQGELCETRPIAGTRPRGLTPDQERRLRRDLVASPKERAEHVMLVDLERNDLGRVCRPHSVRVSEFMTLEPYSHVVHIVSNIVGRLKKSCDQFDLLKAVFPGGTVTGCPKIRSMEIIEELEPFKRNLYTGSIGYLDFNGNMDLNIVIRSLILHRNKGYLQVGAGIVYDSDPEAEYWECLHKGKALLDALCMNG